MKISAIRLAEVGRFSAPVAVEGLSEGLNVLAGPNELGKSTLLSALIAAFTQPHDRKNKDIAALQTYAGGAPQIEVDFEAGGRAWRLVKRYLQGATAELIDRERDTVVSRRSDVQAHLDRLNRGAEGLERFGLVWVRQGESLVPVSLGDETVDPLRRLLEREVQGLAIDELAERVHAAVRARLASLTSHRGTRSSGEFKEAEAARDAAAVEARQAGELLAGTRDRLDRLAAASAAAAVLRDPVAEAGRARAVTAADAALAAAREAQVRARQAELAARTATTEAETARDALQRFDAAVAEHAAAQAQAASHRSALSMQAAEATETVRVAHAAAAALELVSRALDAALAALEAGRRAHALGERIARRDTLAERLTHVRALALEHRGRSAALQASALPAEAVMRLRRNQAALDGVAARLAAVSPEVTFDLAPGGARQIKIDRKAIGATRQLTVRAPTQIDITGIGRITIAPGGGAGTGSDRGELDLLSAMVAGDLAALGVGSLAEAEQRLEAQRQDGSAVDLLKARLDALAPDGIERLAAELAALIAATDGAAAPTMLPDLDRLEAERRRLADARVEAEVSLTRAQARVQAAEVAAIRLEAALGAELQRAATVERQLGDAAMWPQRRRELATRATETATAAAAAVRDVAAWREATPEAARFAALEADERNARLAAEAAARRLIALDLEIRELEATLKAEADSDVEQRARAAGEALALATRRVEALAADVAALRLIDRKLSEAAASDYARLAAPLITRMAPYLEQVLPQARLDLDAGLTPSTLARKDAREPIERLSRGTAEQIAVIARLGLARLLADRGTPAPLILDDALVYADDRRIESLFGALREAARHHQVIVLTCRERTFAALGGTRLVMTTR